MYEALAYLCEEPFGNGVGAESAMVYCEAGCVSLVHEVQVEARQVARADIHITYINSLKNINK